MLGILGIELSITKHDHVMYQPLAVTILGLGMDYINYPKSFHYWSG